MTPPAGVVTLGQIATRLTMLEAVYNRCDRRGRLRIDRLLAEYRPGLPMPDLHCIIAADYPCGSVAVSAGRPGWPSRSARRWTRRNRRDHRCDMTEPSQTFGLARR